MRALALVCLGITTLIPEAGAETRAKPTQVTAASAIRTGSTNVGSTNFGNGHAAQSTAGSPAYVIIANSGDRTKRSFAVQLERRTTEIELQRIAADIRFSDLGIEDASTVVMFYLPGMKLGHGVWAHAFFAGVTKSDNTAAQEPKITIVGLSIAEEERLILAARTDNRNLVGAWLTSAPAPVGKLTLYRDKGRMFAEWGLRDGTSFAEEVVETALADGSWRYDRRDGGTGEYLRMTADGTLELRDRQDVVTSTQTIKRHPGDFNLAVAKTNQTKGVEVKLSEGRAAQDKTDSKKLSSLGGKGTIITTTVGSVTTTAGTTDKTAKTKTALPVDQTTDSDALANVMFR
jgi:hypothetical protein